MVVDYLNRAKSVDAGVTNTVNSQLATYEAVTPSTEDKFFTLGYEQGQRVQVNGTLDSCPIIGLTNPLLLDKLLYEG